MIGSEAKLENKYRPESIKAFLRFWVSLTFNTSLGILFLDNMAAEK